MHKKMLNIGDLFVRYLWSHPLPPCLVRFLVVHFEMGKLLDRSHSISADNKLWVEMKGPTTTHHCKWLPTEANF
jgi:hypothetical protein